MTNRAAEKTKGRKIRKEDEDNNINRKTITYVKDRKNRGVKKSLVLMLIKGSREMLELITLCLLLLLPVICLLAAPN